MSATSPRATCNGIPQKFRRRLRGHGFLQRALGSSPFYGALQHFQFREMEPHFTKMLNSDWRVQPTLRFVGSALLAGCLLVEKHQILHVNCIETYSRLLSLDAHFERFDVTSTLPPRHWRYRDVRVSKVHHDHAVKVLIGTKISSFLIVSSIQVDSDLGPELGPTTSNFTPSSTPNPLLTPNRSWKSSCINLTTLTSCFS